MTCKETLFELITAIEACPLPAITFSSSYNDGKKWIAPTDFTVDRAKVLQIPMKTKTGELSEKSSFSLSGMSYEVTITWQARDVNKETYTLLDALRNANHLIIKTYAQTDYLIQADEFGYRFTYEEKEGELDCKLNIRNLMGAKRIIHS